MWWMYSVWELGKISCQAEYQLGGGMYDSTTGQRLSSGPPGVIELIERRSDRQVKVEELDRRATHVQKSPIEK